MWGMIIETTKQKVQTSGNMESASCSIDAEDMRYIASLLRNNYSDTILATIREIIANGIDVSNGRKVEVQLPTKLEPTFIVRDYGCGLSEEDMMGLYTKYGKSTKRDFQQRYWWLWYWSFRTFIIYRFFYCYVCV